MPSIGHDTTSIEEFVPSAVPRFSFHMGRVHIPPNRDWSLYLTLWGFQFEVNIALPAHKEASPPRSDSRPA